MGYLYERGLPCVDQEGCGSSDALAIYEQDEDKDYRFDASCYSCDKVFKQDELIKEGLIASQDGKVSVPPTPPSKRKKKQGVISEEQKAYIESITKIDKTKFRGIAEGVNKRYQTLTEYNDSGEVLKRYYPVTENGKLVGYKVRVVANKFFYSIGRTGSDTDLHGQARFKPGGKYLLITSGEEDSKAAYEILMRNQAERGNSHFEPVPVVSPSTSETASLNNLKHNYSYIDSFEKIILCFDDDEKGQEFAKKAIEVLPPGKAHLMKMPKGFKDPNEILLNKENKAFVASFYNASRPIPKGVVTSSSLGSCVREELLLKKIPLPPFMKKLQEMTAGGIPLGYIVNIGAASGVGKTSIINEIIYYWIFNSPYKIGIVSLELSKGQYGIAMLSRHLGRKLQLFENPEDALQFLDKKENQKKEAELWENEHGESRWVLLDEREGTIDSLKKQITQLIIAMDCKVIVLDPLQDVLDSSTNEEQADFMRFQKQMVKQGVTFVNINHVRKSGTGEKAGSQGRDLVEEDFAGSSTIFKSGGINILAMRDKYAEDIIVRNTTRAVLSKCRTTGITGPAGEWYYDNNTHTLYDKASYFENNTIEASVPDDQEIYKDFMEGYPSEIV